MNSNQRIQVEGAWDRIMKDETNKAANEAYQAYESHIKENIEMKLPFLKEDLKVHYKAAKDRAYEILSRRYTGDVP